MLEVCCICAVDICIIRSTIDKLDELPWAENNREKGLDACYRLGLANSTFSRRYTLRKPQLVAQLPASSTKYPPQRCSKEVELHAHNLSRLILLFEAVRISLPSSYLTSLFLSPFPESNCVMIIFSSLGGGNSGDGKIAIELVGIELFSFTTSFLCGHRSLDRTFVFTFACAR